MEFRQAFLSLRWLLIILSCYLTLFSPAPVVYSPAIAIHTALFVLTNLALTWVPRERFSDPRVYRATDIADIIFVSTGFHLLGVQQTYLQIAFTIIFVMAVIWRD